MIRGGQKATPNNRLGRVEDRLAQIGAGAHGKPTLALIGALAVTDEALTQEGLVQHADDVLSAVLQRDQGAPGRHAGDRRLGAVDRVDYPGEAGVGPLVPMLLAEDAVVQAGLVDEGADRPTVTGE